MSNAMVLPTAPPSARENQTGKRPGSTTPTDSRSYAQPDKSQGRSDSGSGSKPIYTPDLPAAGASHCPRSGTTLLRRRGQASFIADSGVFAPEPRPSSSGGGGGP